MIDLSPDAIFVHTGGEIVYANAAFLQLIGAADSRSVIGQRAFSFAHPDDHRLVEQRIRALTAAGGRNPATPQRFVRLDGAVVDVEVVAMALEYEGQPSIQVIARDIGERMRQQQALQRSEARYRGLFENSSELIYRFDAHGQILEVNPSVIRVTGWTPEQIAGKTFDRFVHPGDLEAAQRAFRATITGETSRVVIRIRKRDGGFVFLDTVNNPEIQAGVVVALFGAGRDITQTRAAIAQLEERENLLSTVLDQLPIAVAVLDESGTIVRSNPAGDAIWGFHRTHAAIAAPNTYHAWWRDSGRPLEPEEWASSRALGRGETSINEEVEIEAADGRRRIILNSAAPLIDESGRIRGAVVINQDVTEMRGHEQQRESLAVRLRQVISSTSDGVCTIDADGNVTLVNPAAEEMLGSTQDALLGSDLHAVLHPRSGALQPNVFVEVMRERVPRPLYEAVFRKHDDSTFDAEVSCAPILVGEKAHGAVVTFRDVTRRNSLERELERSERLSSIGQLAATVAHEFNNVLMGISPFIEVIDRRARSDEQLRTISGHIQQALQRGKQITREILKFAQAPEPEVRPTAIAPLLQSSVPELAAVAGRRIVVNLAPVDAELAASIDPTQVHQALSNLVSNARDAMNNEGAITIEAGVPGREEIRHLVPEEWVRISVTDGGSGIAPQYLERIFEPMYTTKQAGGTGLGLAVVQQVVRKHGGIVEVDSTVGSGTTFRMYFRRCVAPEISAKPSGKPEARALRTVLLVEDDENVSAGLIAVMELESITVHLVTRGADAVDAVARFAPDAVVLDRGLPDMDGLEVSRRLLSRWPRLPLVFSTGHGGREDIDEMAKNARVAYLLKPYSVSTLLDLLEEVVKRESP